MPQTNPQSQSPSLLGKRSASDAGLSFEPPGTRVAIEQYSLSWILFMRVMPRLSVEEIKKLEKSWELIVKELGKPVDVWFPLVLMAFVDPEESSIHEVLLHRLLAEMDAQRLLAFILKLRELGDVSVFLRLTKIISHKLCFQLRGDDTLKIVLKRDHYLLIDVGRHILDQHARSWFIHRPIFAFLSDEDYLSFLKDIVRSVNKDREALCTFIYACQPNIHFQIGDRANSPISIVDYILECIFSEVSQDPLLRRAVLCALFRSKLEAEQYFPLLQRIYTTMDDLLLDISQAIPAPEQRDSVVRPLIVMAFFNNDSELVKKLLCSFLFEDVRSCLMEPAVAASHHEAPVSLAQIESQRPAVTSGLLDKEAQLTALLNDWRKKRFGEQTKGDLYQCIAGYGNLVSVLRVILFVYRRNPEDVQKGFLLVGSKLDQTDPCQAILTLLFKTAALREEFVQPVLSAFSANFNKVLIALADAIQGDQSILPCKKIDVFLAALNGRAITNSRMTEVMNTANSYFLREVRSALHRVALNQVCSTPTLTAYLKAVNDSYQETAFFCFIIHYAHKGLSACLAALITAGWGAETLVEKFACALYDIRAQKGAFVALHYSLKVDWKTSKPLDDSLPAQIFIRLVKKMLEKNRKSDELLEVQGYFNSPKDFQSWCLDLSHAARDMSHAPDEPPALLGSATRAAVSRPLSPCSPESFFSGSSSSGSFGEPEYVDGDHLDCLGADGPPGLYFALNDRALTDFRRKVFPDDDLGLRDDDPGLGDPFSPR